LAEFTGERVVPGKVEVDLWNEHVARYVFATRFAEGKRVLDAGCGSGYGAARLALKAFRVLGVDLAKEAIDYARLHYPMSNLHFLQASCTQLPARDGTFDLVVAFEIIEHLKDWETFLEEACRLLAADGRFIVSTPNQEYYAASRGSSEPNPYHLHEFGFEEFREALGKLFRHVSMWMQNQVAAFALHPVQALAPAEAFVESSGGEARHAHFFVAVCSNAAPAEVSSWIYVPKAANILRERELHIERLQGELAEKNRTLDEEQAEKQKLVEMFRQQTADLQQSNRWATQLDAALAAAKNRIVALQQELAAEQEAARQMAAAYEAQVADLEGEVRKRTEWALETERRLEGELERKGQELAECVRLLDQAEATVTERTLWAQRLQTELEQAEARLGMVRASRWMRLGRTLGLGPRLGNG
jgi:2-polyprenyl-3-methyl-5-hydroxy-6-metoxy-1,4-benzoquinol methylase